MKDQAIKAFEGAGKARKLHLTDSLHFPSLYNYHWFLFTFDIRDKKFIFMDSLFDKNSDLHQEVDNRMIMNFGRTWSECRLKDINFQEFEVIYPPVPKQRNGKDCGIHLMKSIELFKPRTSSMGKFSHKDIPDFRIQMANEMMFCEHNEMHEIQEAVMTFKPHVHGTYARMG
ncbi:putative ubiquitin-like-specific protease 1B [Lolium perenne]|uniref:putative ubiquitin-like-specific protease 1B n=1 Tax=Lolium perenne TaxID=4522 RepID=UPI0021F510C9|nr:putative ubiquitin-like-specific protease 1B [Lolium perenne]